MKQIIVNVSGLSVEEKQRVNEALAKIKGIEKQGHVHADLMALYAEDAKTTDKPWELWQTTTADIPWGDLQRTPAWNPLCLYRRKPKTHTVNGVEVPNLRFVPCDDQYFYKPEPYARALVAMTTLTRKSRSGEDMIKHNLCYEYTEAGKQAAILHAKAWLGIA